MYNSQGIIKNKNICQNMDLSQKHKCDYDVTPKVVVQCRRDTLQQTLPCNRCQSSGQGQQSGSWSRGNFSNKGKWLFCYFWTLVSGYAFIKVLKDRKLCLQSSSMLPFLNTMRFITVWTCQCLCASWFCGYKRLQGYSWQFLPLSRAIKYIFHNCKVS